MRHGFISYAHEDRDVCDTLRKHLKPVEAAYDFNFWIDKRNHTGQHFDVQIEQAISAACAHLILTSSNSLWSDIIRTMEIPAIQQKQHSANDLVMIVVADRCAWQFVTGTLLASPRDKKLDLVPLRDWKTKNHGYDAAREQIATAIERHFGLTAKPLASWKKP